MLEHPQRANVCRGLLFKNMVLHFDNCIRNGELKMNQQNNNSNLKMVLFLESIRWFLVNTLMCQIPIIIMIIQGFSKVEILYSGLSYAVTLLIVANYTLEDFNFSGLIKTSLVFWLLICVVFLAIYQSIKIEYVNGLISKNTVIIYCVIIGVSNLMAFMSSWRLLKNNAVEILKKKLDQIRAEAEKTQENLNVIQRDIELSEGDL